jgi:hypothetical protein
LPEELVDVEITLAHALPGAGRVVDRESGEPVAGAEVEVIGAGGLGLPWLSFTCSQDGTFECEAFVRGANSLRVRASGHAEVGVTANCSGDFLDWGDIRLPRPQALELRLTGLEAWNGDLAQLTTSSVNGPKLPVTSFDRGGVARFEAVPPGDAQVVIDESPSVWTRLQLRLDPGADWLFEHRIGGGKRVDVRVLKDGAVAESVHQILVATVEPSGIFTIRSRNAHEDGVYAFEGLESDSAQVWIIDGGVTLANKTVTFGAESRLVVDVEIDSEFLRMRVVDVEGDALASATVTLRNADGESILGLDDTDSSGWAELAGIPAERVIADVYHDVVGWRFGVPIDASVREQEFVLAAEGSLVLKLVDGDVALADVTTRIETPSGTVLTRPRPTGVDGTVRYEPLGEGQYRIVCRRSDCWRAVADVALAAGEKATPTVRMRRLAELELVVRSAEGTPLVGVEVELRSSEFEASVADWIGQKAVEGELRTDKDGKLRLKGLPSGPYVWSVSGPAGAGGSLELAPGANVLDVGRGL